LAILGTTNYADVEVAVSYRGSAEIGGSRHHGVIARYVDSSNYLRLSHQSTTSVGDVWLEIVVGGAATQILEMGSAMTVDTWFRLRLVVFASGFGIATWLDANGAVLDSKQFQHAALATGGALATGKVGIIDRNGSAFASTRYYDDFAAATPPAEPLAVAPSRSLEIRSGGAIRQSTDGTLWVPAQLEGFYPRVPPAWAEGRTLRVLVATCRGPKLADSVWADPGIDDLSARLTYTPLSLNLPEA
jgi:hypothetical protein